MKKYTILLLFLLLFIQTQAENLLPNHDFSHDLAGFLLGDAQDMRVVPYKFTETNYGRSISFTAKPAERVALYLPEVQLQPKTDYEISFMAKSSLPVPLIISQYIRVGRNVGSAGKFYPEVGTGWQKYKFTFNSGNKEKWGGFRIVKNNNVNEKTVELSFTDLYIGIPKLKPIRITGSFQWDPLDRRIDRNKPFQVPVRIVSKRNTPVEKTIIWKIESLYDNMVIQEGQVKKSLEPGINEFSITIDTEKLPNGTLKLEGWADGQKFINNLKFTICPKAKATVGELPVDIGLNNIFSQPSKTLVTDDELALLADCGISFIRTWDGGNPFLWRNIEPKEGHFNFRNTDRLVEATNKAGLELLVVLGGMCFTYPPSKRVPSHALPNWLYEKSTIVSCPPNMPQFTRIGRQTALPPMACWTRLVTSIVDRYKDKITYYEVMNEPNLFFTEEQYLPYLKSAYTIIKNKVPSSTIVGICATGDYDGHIIDYVDNSLKLGAGNYLDALSFHAYQSMFEDSRKAGDDVIKEFYKFLAKNNLKNVKLWNTELYYLNPNSQSGSDHKNGPRYHPGYLIRRYLLDAANGVRSSIAVPGNHLLEPCLVNENFQQNHLSRFFINRLLPNNRYVASAIFAKLLKGTKFKEAHDFGNDVRAYVFTGSSKAVAAIFALYPKEKEDRKLSLPADCNTLNILGNPYKNSQKTVAASPIPFYITAKSTEELSNILKSISISK